MMLAFVSLAGALQNLPVLIGPAKTLSALILVWFSWKIATSGRMAAMRAASRRVMLFEGCALQAVNPKAWAAGLAFATGTMDSAGLLGSAGMVGALVFVVIFAALLVWAASGQGLCRFLECGTRRRTFNVRMASALLGVGLPGLVM